MTKQGSEWAPVATSIETLASTGAETSEVLAEPAESTATWDSLLREVKASNQPIPDEFGGIGMVGLDRLIRR